MHVWSFCMGSLGPMSIILIIFFIFVFLQLCYFNNYILIFSIFILFHCNYYYHHFHVPVNLGIADYVWQDMPWLLP